MATDSRAKGIIRVSIVGIAANLLLAAGKAAVGLAAHSIAIVLDAVNNVSDALSSVVTVIGTKIADRPADREHPYGHGRFEYLSAMIVAAIILYAGVTALGESFQKLLHPSVPDYRPVTLGLVGAAVAVKLGLGRYFKKAGEKLQSDSLVNSGQDALMDAVISLSTLLAAILFLSFGIRLEAWLGLVIALLIIKTGLGMFRRTVSKILGERVDSALSKAVKATICSTEGVAGAYDLILSSYGPQRWMGSVHIEVPDTWTADKIDAVCRDITHRVATENHVILSAIGIYSKNSTGDFVKEVQTRVTETVMAQEYVLQIHGFYCDVTEKIIRFDLVIDFIAPDPEAVYTAVQARVQALYPDYQVLIQQDSDYSD